MKKDKSKVLFLATVKEILVYFKNNTGIEGLPDLDKAIEILKPLNVKFSSDTYLKALGQWENFQHDNLVNISIQKYSLTKENKELIHRMFFGPYLDEWKDKKGLVNNSDEAISTRIGIPVHYVTAYIRQIEEEHFNNVNNRVNKTEDENKMD